MQADNQDTLAKLWATLVERRDNPRPGSYTAELLESSDGEIARKVGEEAVEVMVAALRESDQRLIEESADLTYHLLVLLLARGLTWNQVLDELTARHNPPNKKATD